DISISFSICTLSLHDALPICEDILATIKRLAAQKEGPTILFVTHHIEEILPIFSHTLLLRQGAVFAQGEREKVLNSASLTNFFRSEEHTSELQSRFDLVCRLL